LMVVRIFRAVGRVTETNRFHPPGKLSELFGFPKDDNKITNALTYEGMPAKQDRPDRIAKRVALGGKRPLS